MKRGQISFEYLILMGFVVLILGVILGIAFYYTGGIQDKVRISQAINFANKISSTAESVFSSGQPSKATIKAYLPEGIKNITIIENTLFIEIQTSSGLNKIAFPSEVSISGSITPSAGLKKLQIVATESSATISQV